LADSGYAGKVGEVIHDAAEHNVSQMLSNATDYKSSLATINLAKAFPERVLAAVGVHPLTVLQSSNLHLEEFGKLIDENSERITAIGEVGLDGKYTQDERLRAKQLEVFRFFLGLAEEKHLPVIVHSRQAVSETLDTLSDFHAPNTLLHWYDGAVENLKSVKERGYFISIGPALLYSRRILEIARIADIDSILSETDGPVIYRGLFDGRLTLPSFVIDVVQKLAEVKGSSSETIRSAMLSNFRRLTNR
jgi:TatD DNase family protein